MILVGDKFELEPGVFAKCPSSSGTARNDCNCRYFFEYELMNIWGYAKATNKTVDVVKKQLGISDNTKDKLVSNDQFTNLSNNDIIKIRAIINQRNTGKGNPNAILQFDVDLNNRQRNRMR